MTARRTIYITANSPGEISGFLVPVVASLRRQLPGFRCVVIMLPCTFATGREEAVARAVPGVDAVIPTRRLLKMLLRGLPEPGAALIHLGGDLMYAALLARRSRIPAWAFQWANPMWDRFLRGYFVKTAADAERMHAQGIAPGRVAVIGDLVVDSVRSALGGAVAADLPAPSADAASPAAPHVVFLPGSRPQEIVMLSRFFLEVAEHVRAVMPKARFSLLVSPFVDWGRVRPGLEMPIDLVVGGIPGSLSEVDGQAVLTSAAGTRLALVREGMLAAMASGDFVVSIPGTKTGEAGSLGKPMLVVLPTNRMEEIPWHGLLGMLDWLPVVGRLVKVLIYRTMVDRYIGRVYSQPNLMAPSPVVPEMIGFLTPMLVADKVLAAFGRAPLGRDPLPLRGRVQGQRGPYSVNGALESDWARMRVDLHAVYHPFSGAADRAVRAISDALGAQPSQEGM